MARYNFADDAPIAGTEYDTVIAELEALHSLRLGLSGDTVVVKADFPGTLKYLTNASKQSAATIKSTGSTLAISAAGLSTLDLSGSTPGETILQAVNTESVTGLTADSNPAYLPLTVAATLSAPSGASNGGSVQVATNATGAGSGTLYYRVRNSVDALPSVGTIKAGGGVDAGSVSEPSSSPHTFTVDPALSAGTYIVDFVQDNGSNSAISTSGGFTVAGSGITAEVAFSFGGSGTTFTSSTFSLQNRPLAIFVFDKSASSSTGQDKTVTLDPGGDDTAVPQRAIVERGSIHLSGHFVDAPGSGTVAVRVVCASNMNRVHVLGIYCDGVTDVGATDPDQITGTTVSPSFSTGGANHAAIYASMTAAYLNSIAASGATQIEEGASATELRYCAAFETVASAGTATATFTTSSTSFIGLGMELEN